MALRATLHEDGRAAERHPLEADATLRTPEQAPADILIVNLSATGCLFVCATPIETGVDVTIGIAGLGRRAVRIRRREDTRYGAEFVAPLDAADIAAVLDAPADTVVSLQPWGATPIVTEAPPAAAKLPRAYRLAVLGAMTVATWLVLLAATTGLS